MRPDKDALRARMKAQRQGLDAPARAALSAQVCQRVARWAVYRSARTVLLYAPIGRELDLLSLAQAGDKQFFLPRMVDGVQMQAVAYAPGTPLQKGRYGFLAPEGPAIEVDKLDLVLAPALACGRDGTRLGYGKGCYDRFLAGGFRGCAAAAVYDEALLSSVPQGPEDVRMDFIVTPSGVYAAKGGTP